jgi:rSAM/selenodomain-associated transferase 1
MTVSIAILAKAPIPGFAKTRLIPAIGAHAAATVQERLTEQTVATACAAGLGKVTLWCAPDPTHASFRGLAARFPVVLAQQPSGDLGARMLATFANGPTLAIGTDCPPLTVAHLQRAAATLAQADIVVIPAEDGGYVLIGAQAAHASLFDCIAWGTDRVLAETRARAASAGLSLAALDPLWDVDSEEDLVRMERERPMLAL